MKYHRLMIATFLSLNVLATGLASAKDCKNCPAKPEPKVAPKAPAKAETPAKAKVEEAAPAPKPVTTAKPKSAKRVSGLPAEGYTDTLKIPGQKWRVHDKERPEPGIVSAKPAEAPSDAIVLFDGKDLSNWQGGGGKEAKWKIQDGYMEVNGTGSITTKQKFASCQLHLEWASPVEVKGKSQGRGNSGVMIMTLYEVQILDSFNNRTYSDGQAAAIYGQFPPTVNASRGPGQWQTYDIIFEAPKFEGDKVVKPAYLTVLHNGVLVHNHTKLSGRVFHKDPTKYVAHPPEMPLQLQDHGNPVRFRNVWIRPLKGYDE